MSAHDVAISLRHMRDAARRALEIAEPLRREELEENRVETLALIRLIEVVGEAARRVPDELRNSHRAIPWRQIVGTRDRLIHGYDQVDLDVLWTILREQLPGLVGHLDGILSEFDRR